uniref:Developmentally-regulated GTP-binding protein 1 n=1 Tax=Eutreptiella gymnastica TaxID=73025 RepID=A0A7S1HUF8_9EUGL
MSVLQKIADIEAEMARTQKNKATMSHLGSLKAKIAKLRRELLSETKGAGGGGGIPGFDVARTGDARIGYIGFPSVGKSTLLNKMTSTFSEVAEYEFTTLTCVPGVVRYRGAKLQMLDLPGIIEGAKDGKGRGRQVIAVARTCNLILLVLDVQKPMTHKLIIERELEGYGIRMNTHVPNISIKTKERGGLTVSSTCKLTQVDTEVVTNVMKEYRMNSVDICFKEDATVDQLVDVIEGNRVYCSCIYVMNKIDQITVEELDIINRIPHNCPISAKDEWNLDGLLECIWEHLDLIRVYTKPKGQIPDYNEPVILKSDPTVEDFCNKLHRMMIKSFKHAWVWGSSAKHNPQKVGKDHVLKDEDIVQIVKKI